MKTRPASRSATSSRTITAYLRLLANAAESNHWGPKHRFWFTEAPKINAIHILGQYRKAVAVKKKIMTAHDNRYAAQL